MHPVVTVQLRDVKPAFALPRQVAGVGVLREENSAAAPDAYVLEICGTPEPKAIPRAIEFISSIRLASQCSASIVRYMFPNGSSIDGFDGDGIIWGHYDALLNDETVAWVEKHLAEVAPFTMTETFSRIGNAIRLHSTAMETRNSDLALLGFVGAIESLFSIAPQELSFRLSLLLARFLGDTVDEQRAYFDRARDLYVVRSKIAHGDKINKSEEAAAIQITEHWTPEAEELARLALRRIVERKLIEVFNSKNLHESLLVDLLFEPNLEAAITRLK